MKAMNALESVENTQEYRGKRGERQKARDRSWKAERRSGSQMSFPQ